MLLPASRHPRVLTSWLCLHLELLAGQQTSHPEGADEISITVSHLLLSSSSSHTLHPNPSLFPLSLSEVSGDSGPCYLAPPFIVEERKREGERERLQPTTTMSPEAPCLPACLPACPSCCSVQLWLSTRPRPAGILTLPESHVKSHCLKAPRLSH